MLLDQTSVLVRALRAEYVLLSHFIEWQEI